MEKVLPSVFINRMLKAPAYFSIEHIGNIDGDSYIEMRTLMPHYLVTSNKHSNIRIKYRKQESQKGKKYSMILSLVIIPDILEDGEVYEFTKIRKDMQKKIKRALKRIWEEQREREVDLFCTQIGKLK